MKKLMALLCITALFCGCSSKNNSSEGSQPTDNASSEAIVTDDTGDIPTEEDTTKEEAPTDPNLESDPSEILITGEQVDMSNVSNVSWEKIYRSALDDFKKSENYSENARFTVYDINDDLIPELVISYGEGSSKTFLVKTLYNGIYTEFEAMENCDQLNYIMDRSLLTTVRYHDDIQVQNIQLYRIKSGMMANVGSFQLSNTAAKVDGAAVSRDDYEAEYKHIFSGVVKNMGLDFGFDDETIDAALGNSADWKQGYEAVLNDYLKYKKQYDNNFFSMKDINGDDIPELFVSGGFHYAPYVDIYSWNGCVVPVGSFGADGTIGYDPDKKELISIFEGPSYAAGSIYSFNENYKFSELFSYGNNENSRQQDENVEVVYYLDGEKTDKKTYDSTVKDRIKKSYYVLGQDNDITEETVKAVSEGKYTEASKK